LVTVIVYPLGSVVTIWVTVFARGVHMPDCVATANVCALVPFDQITVPC
jgi:hypothetical protein